MSGGGPTRKRGHKLQPGLLAPCALKGARTVLRGRGSGDTSSLPGIFPSSNKGKNHPKKFKRIHYPAFLTQPQQRCPLLPRKPRPAR